MMVPEHCLDRLRAAGLLVSEPFDPNLSGWPQGVAVGKPDSVRGNCIPGTKRYWGASGQVVDAPCPYLHFDAGSRKWVVTVHEYIPGPGPGDFVNVWDTPEEAVTDILDYLLGDPARMRVNQGEREAFFAPLDDATGEV
jgi:hypothetical protein